MPRILAIDQSTSATKAIVFDQSGQVIDKASLEHRQIYPQPGWVEHDAEEIWRNTTAAIARLPLSEVEFLSITNQRETIVVFDRATSRPLHNAIVWQCRRGTPVCDELVRQGHGEAITAKTGLKVDTYFSASKLKWLVDDKPAIGKSLRDGSACIGTMDTYLIHRLTGGAVWATDHTNASRTLLFDIEKLRWDERLCELFLVPMRSLPEVRSSTARYGEAELIGIDGAKRVPIIGVMGDSQAALFAQRCMSPGSAKVTLGTGSSVLLNIGDRARPGGAAAVSTVAWTHDGRPTYCFEGIINYAAATIEWLRTQFGIIKDASECEALATSVTGNGGVFLVPAFAGLSAPHWSPGATAAIVGLTGLSTKAHVVRAALEAIAFQIHDVLGAMKVQAGVDLAAIHADGGPTRNKFLMQFIADITGVTIAAADVAECSALGAAMAGMLGSGLCKSYDDLTQLPRTQTVYRPQMPAVQREGLLSGWQRAVKQVLCGVDAVRR
ncbi:MAG TPA: glycerol kinase GlpK [Tepidisphaeraceae bacterium]|nr:glycerol kinase GlpK [Tepidisphaeraceae bacterium]